MHSPPPDGMHILPLDNIDIFQISFKGLYSMISKLRLTFEENIRKITLQIEIPYLFNRSRPSIILD